jgi:polysaccharide export outer membrane protein
MSGLSNAGMISLNMMVPKYPFLLILAAFYLVGCASSREQTKNSVYFSQLSDSLLNQPAVEYSPVFQKGDILSINVITPNETSARLFNQQGPAAAAGASEGQAPSASQGYLVDESGNITFPYIGAVRASGLKRAELTESLGKKLQQFVDSPIVSVRLLNYRITVLGEVSKPGTFSIPSERVTVLDAIGLAGDLTVYGRRNNIRIIRTADGNRQTATLDLNKGNIFDSPFFYLRQNDIVYVEMNERKIPNSDQASLRNVSIALGIISALGVVISTINVLR